MRKSMSTTLALSRCRARSWTAALAAGSVAVAAVTTLILPVPSLAQTPPEEAAPAAATLRVTSDPPGALVVLEGEHTVRGRTPFTISRGLSGRYEVKAYAPGYDEWTSTIDIDPTTDRTLSIELSKRSRVKATLRSMIFPGWGQHYSGQETKSLVFVVGELAALGWMGVEHVQYSDEVDQFEEAERSYLNAKEIEDIQQKYAEMERRREDAADQYDQRQTALYVAGAIWAVNVLDTLLFFPSSGQGFYSQIGSGGELYAGFRMEF